MQANAAADRACASRLVDLSLSEKKFEKRDIEAVRKGYGHNVWEPKQNGRAGCGFFILIITQHFSVCGNGDNKTQV